MSNSYWQKRAEMRMDIYHDNAEEYLNTLKRSYGRALRSIKDASSKVINNFAKANDLTLDQALKLMALYNKGKLRDVDDLVLNSLDEETREAVERFKSDQAYRHRLEQFNQRQAEVDKLLNDLGTRQTQEVRDLLTDTVEEAFNRTMFDTQQRASVGFSFTKPNAEAIKQIVNGNWTGKRTFSQSIWGHFQRANAEIQRTLLRGFLTGESIETLSGSLSRAMGVTYRQAERLVRTETTHAAVQAEMEAYKAAGIEQYTFLATLDSRTCETCGEMDGKRFDVDKQQPGVNCPPMHANCRCTTVVADGVDAERIARDADGNTYKVPSDMTYDEWKKLQKTKSDATIISGGVTGARNPNSEEASAHAERYYGLVRSMSTDVSKIAKVSGFSEDQIRDVKSYIFFEKHELGIGELERFEPDYMMAESWRRLMTGKPEPHDFTLLKHEMLERDLVRKGLSQQEAHIRASKQYNYSEEARKFHDKIEKYKN